MFDHTSPTIEVVGRTRLDAVVSIGGAFVEVDEDGRFQTSVQLELGSNVIEVLASVETGEVEFVVIIVIYEL